ncbi:MAG: GNAT family N-acetyltransferase [Muribaculaceae bacterium]|nr:GNAT family N-acetyltransferase [Muribaculaceae bacterium]
MTIEKCTAADHLELSDIWERSVRTSHNFLPEDIIKEIKDSLIHCYFQKVDLYALKKDHTPIGFIGLSGIKIEMLFIDSNKQGLHYGSMLIEFAKQNGARLVDVNEQNPSALEFYKAKGFNIIGRDQTDDAGRPYPILHLSL